MRFNMLTVYISQILWWRKGKWWQTNIEMLLTVTNTKCSMFHVLKLRSQWKLRTSMCEY